MTNLHSHWYQLYERGKTNFFTHSQQLLKVGVTWIYTQLQITYRSWSQGLLDCDNVQCWGGSCCLHLLGKGSPKHWYPTTTLQCHNLEDLDFKLHHSENLKSHSLYLSLLNFPTYPVPLSTFLKPRPTYDLWSSAIFPNQASPIL